MGVASVFAYGEGSNADRGRKSRISPFAVLWKRGLLPSCGSGRLGHIGCLDGVGIDEAGDLGLERMSDIEGLGRLFLGTEDAGDNRNLGPELLLLVLISVSSVGVRDPKLLFRPSPMMLLAGELPGVSSKLPALDRSLEMTVDTESRRLSPFSLLSSSTTTSTSAISLCKDVQRCFISLCSRKISPLTVSLSRTPRSMMARTRSMAGP